MTPSSMMPYGITMGQRVKPCVCNMNAIPKNVHTSKKWHHKDDLSLVRFCSIHLRVISQRLPKLWFCMNLKVITATSARSQWDKFYLAPLLYVIFPQVLSRLIQEFNHDIPNFKMSRMSTVDDAVQHFQTEIHETTAFEDLSRVDLPPNLHIQWEPVRFNPETDKMFGGRTAYPGQDNVVTSIKFRRKYETIKTTKEKPGYYNHYYDY